MLLLKTILEKCLQTGFVFESILSFVDRKMEYETVMNTVNSSVKKMSQYFKSLRARFFIGLQ